MREVLCYLLVLLVSIESKRIVIFTSDLTMFPNLNAFLSQYDFGIDDNTIEVHSV